MTEVTTSTEKESRPSAETGAGLSAAERWDAAEREKNTSPGAITEQKVERHEAKSELLYQKIVSQVQSTSAQTQTGSDDDAARDLDAKTIAALGDMRVQVERLVQLAELKGVVYAVQVAKQLDFYVLDQVHDQLANHLYDQLVNKGMIVKE